MAPALSPGVPSWRPGRVEDPGGPLPASRGFSGAMRHHPLFRELSVILITSVGEGGKEH